MKGQNLPIRVVMEVTENSHKTTVYHGDEVIAERSASRENSYSFKGGKGDFYDDLDEELGDDFPDALESIQMNLFGLAQTLQRVGEES